MGWKGNLRSYNAALKRAEKYQKQVEKQRHLENCRDLVAKYEFHVNELVSFHMRCSSSINWEEMRSKMEPITPVRKYVKGNFAKGQFKSYQPNWFVKFLKLEKLMKRYLLIKLVKARKEDKKIYNSEYEAFKDAHEKWDKNKKLATKIFAKDIIAYEEVLLEENTFDKIGSIGTDVSLSFNEIVPVIKIKVNDEDIFPRNSYSLLKSGKLSEKEIPKTQFYRTYQDHVCSVVLRIAREFTTIFPLDEVIVSATCDLLNPVTGHIEEQIILSVQIPKDTLSRLNMTNINPSDAMKNFRHNMSFKNGVGFGPVEKIKILVKPDAA